jgi:hypothetical protein
VSLTEAKLWCRVTHTAEDAQFEAAITAAREICEAWTRRQFITATWKMVMDRFDGSWYERWRGLPIFQSAGEGYHQLVRIPLPPLQSVSSVKYVHSQTGVLTTLDSELYRVDEVNEPGRLTPEFDEVWPDVRQVTNAVEVVFVAGYGSASAVPASIKQAIKTLVALWYVNREMPSELPDGVKNLLRAVSYDEYR